MDLNGAPGPLDFYCMFCSAAQGTACTDLSGNVVPPHRKRQLFAENAAGQFNGVPYWREAW